MYIYIYTNTYHISMLSITIQHMMQLNVKPQQYVYMYMHVYIQEQVNMQNEYWQHTTSSPRLMNSQYTDMKPQKSMLSQAISQMPGTFPQRLSQLQSNLNSLPGYMMNMSLYKQIHTYNKKMMLREFDYLCEIVISTYVQARTQRQGVNTNTTANEVNVQQLMNVWCNRIAKQARDGYYYANHIAKEINPSSSNRKTMKQEQEVIQFIRMVMNSLAIAHIQYYQYNSNRYNNKVPEKYITVIDDKLNTIMKPISPNFIQELLVNSFNSNQTQHQPYSHQKTTSEIQAESNANTMNTALNQKYFDKAEGVENPLSFIPFIVTYGGKNTTNTNTNTHQQNMNINFVMNTLRQSISNQQMNTPINPYTNTNTNTNTNFNQYSMGRSVDFQNWFNNTLSQMTYYESYMMAHMADLIFLQPEKFNIHLIKYFPYLEKLQRHLIQQTNDIKSEQTSFKMVFNSQLQAYSQGYNHNLRILYKRVQQIPLQPIKNVQQIQINEKVSNTNNQKGAINKAKNAILALYQKAKKKDDRNSPKNVPQTNYIQQNQDIKVPYSPAVAQNTYNYVIQDMQMLNNYLYQLKESKPFGNLTQTLVNKLRNAIETVKQKITHDQTHDYYQIQSWMAIVMILYRALALNPQNNYEYTPFRRRTIIKICKRIFIQENKKDGNNKNKENEELPFRNWPVVLKFLQNNRPEIAIAPLSSTIEQDVNKIIEQLYKQIRSRQLAGSSFDNLFAGIQNIRQNLPRIKLVCLSSGSNPTENLNKSKPATQCKVVHILISGFLSEDTDKLGEWSELVDRMPDSEVYALVWESNTISNLVKFFLKSTVAIIGAKKIIDELRKKYTDNPFNPAFEVAQITGRILAQFVMKVFPNRFINVFGYSLGSEVIKQFLRRVIQKNQTHLINNVYIMGGVSDVHLCEQIMAQSPVPLCVYNCYTNHDSVLRQLLSLCKPDIAPVGLVPFKKIQGHSIINVDCTKFISGHLAFRSNLSLMGEMLQIFIG